MFRKIGFVFLVARVVLLGSLIVLIIASFKPNYFSFDYGAFSKTLHFALLFWLLGEVAYQVFKNLWSKQKLSFYKIQDNLKHHQPQSLFTLASESSKSDNVPLVVSNNDLRVALSDTDVHDLAQLNNSSKENTTKTEELFLRPEFLSLIPIPLLIVDSSGCIIKHNELIQDFFDKNLEGLNIEDIIEIVDSTALHQVSIITAKLNLNPPLNCWIFQTSLYDKNIETTVNSRSSLKASILFIIPSLIEVVGVTPNKLDYNCQAVLDSVDHILHGVIILDKNNKVILINQFAKKLLLDTLDNSNQETKINEIVGQDFSEVLLQFPKIHHLERLFEGYVNSLEINVTPDKSLKFSITSRNNDGVTLNIEDVSSHRKLELQNSFSQRLQTVGQIASAVAHDFNNLLTAIMSFTYFIKERYSDDDPSVLELAQIEQNSHRAKVMIRQLLTFSRGGDLKPVSFSVNSGLSDLMSTILRLMGENIKVNFKRGRNIGKITMDLGQFEQVIINLVVNARDAMKKNGGNLNISTEGINVSEPLSALFSVIPVGNYIQINIQDEGDGIKKGNFKKIFQNKFSTKGDKGNGLGLATVASIVQKNGGFISLKSEVGKGSTFTLYFPISEDRTEKTEHKDGTLYSDDSRKNNSLTLQLESDLLSIKRTTDTAKVNKDVTGKETILLVEDELPVRTVCKRALESKGYHVIEAESAEEALTLLQNSTKKIELIISDVMMPGMSGLEFMSKARATHPEVKAILMSGYAEDILEDDHYTLEHIEFLAKPFGPDVLASKVKKVLGSSVTNADFY